MTEALLPGSTVGEALALAHDSETRIDLRTLLGWVLRRSPAWLLTHAGERLDEPARVQFNAAWAARTTGTPVAYLTGEREFHGLPFQVGPGALIPRADTELLVDIALECWPPALPGCVLDLGTGSGVLAVTLAVRRPALQVTATDRMAEALVWAERNARAHGVGDRVELLQGYWLQAVGHRRFDLVVSNPPYIAEGDPHLTLGDLRFEPVTALQAGPDGLADLRQIVTDAPGNLLPGGRLLLEHGFDQGPAVRALLTQRGFTGVETRRDLAGHERVTLGALV